MLCKSRFYQFFVLQVMAKEKNKEKRIKGNGQSREVAGRTNFFSPSKIDHKIKSDLLR